MDDKDVIIEEFNAEDNYKKDEFEIDFALNGKSGKATLKFTSQLKMVLEASMLYARSYEGIGYLDDTIINFYISIYLESYNLTKKYDYYFYKTQIIKY